MSKMAYSAHDCDLISAIGTLYPTSFLLGDACLQIISLEWLHNFSFNTIILFVQKMTDFDEICEEIERETERVTGTNKVCSD